MSLEKIPSSDPTVQTTPTAVAAAVGDFREILGLLIPHASCRETIPNVENHLAHSEKRCIRRGEEVSGAEAARMRVGTAGERGRLQKNAR
jgi:hypothetical protein